MGQEGLSLPRLSFPPHTPRLACQGEGHRIYDPVRRRFVRLTPEEWVRQSLIRYLTDHLGYPFGLMAVERQVRVNGMPQRADVVVYARDMTPYLLVECKGPGVSLGDGALEQVCRYQWAHGARYVAVTNGLRSGVFARDGEGAWYRRGDFPRYAE